MTFSTFEITELPDESENDYALEFQTNDTLQGIMLTETEMQGVGEALLESVETNPSEIDGQSVDEVVSGGGGEA